MNATDLLRRQHDDVRELLRALEATEDRTRRSELLAELTTRLRTHTALEQEMFYPELQEEATDDIDDMVVDAYETHHTIEVALGELDELDDVGGEWARKLAAVTTLLEEHMITEERHLFAAAELLGTERLDALGEEMEEWEASGDFAPFVEEDLEEVEDLETLDDEVELDDELELTDEPDEDADIDDADGDDAAGEDEDDDLEDSPPGSRRRH